MLFFEGNKTPVDPKQQALQHCKNALADLLASNGYKNARLANKKDSVFYTTYAGKCETELRAAITALGG